MSIINNGPPPGTRTVEAIQAVVCERAYGGRPCKVDKDSAAVAGWDLWWAVEIGPDGARDSRQVWVRRESAGRNRQVPSGPPELVIAGVPMTRAQLRSLLEDPAHPVRPFDVARIVAACDGAAVGLVTVHSGERQGQSSEVAGALFRPRVVGEPGARNFEFVAIQRAGGLVVCRVTLDGDGSLGLSVAPLIARQGPQPVPVPSQSAPKPQPVEPQPVLPPGVDFDALFPPQPPPPREPR